MKIGNFATDFPNLHASFIKPISKIDQVSLRIFLFDAEIGIDQILIVDKR